jgi:hypothetical protein
MLQDLALLHGEMGMRPVHLVLGSAPGRSYNVSDIEGVDRIAIVREGVYAYEVQGVMMGDGIWCKTV